VNAKPPYVHIGERDAKELSRCARGRTAKRLAWEADGPKPPIRRQGRAPDVPEFLEREPTEIRVDGPAWFRACGV
jgi:hypothetical protein